MNLRTHTHTHCNPHCRQRHTHTKSPRLSITSTWLFFSLLLFHIPLPDTNPGLKIPFKSTVCRLCFTGRLCYCVITHKQSLPPSLFPSLSPATPPPPSLPLSSAVEAEPLIKSLRQKLLSSEYQVSAFRQEQHWQERGRVGEGERESERRGWQENLLQSTGRRLVCHWTWAAMTAIAAVKKWWLCNYEQGQRSFQWPLMQGDRMWA